MMTPADNLKSAAILRKEVWIGWISSLVEAYNMVIYSFIAPLLAPLLFQEESAWSAVFFSYSLVLIGTTLLYPAGAIYYGYLGDRYGRQNLCVYSTLGLALATGLMGLIPSQWLINGWPYFLVLIGAQHFFSGGEYHGSIVFSLEHSNRKQTGLISALSCLFAVIGLLSANGLATLAFIIKDELWIRACFLAGGLGGMLSFILKKYCSETPAFSSINPETLKKVKWFSFLNSDWRKLVTVVSMLGFFLVSYTFIFIFLPLIEFNGQIDDFSTFKSLIAYGVFLVLSGILSDKVGIQKTMITGLCLFSLVLLPVSYYSHSLIAIQMVLTPCACLVIGPIHSWALNQFEISRRCRGIFMSSAIAMSIFGGSTVPICLMLFETSGSLFICCLYPFAIALASLVCLLKAGKEEKVDSQYLNTSVELKS